MDYDAIQPQVQKEIEDAINARIRATQSDDQYQLSRIQSHLHSGIDSSKIPYTSIQDYQGYRAFQKVTLTPSQVNDLNTTPVEILPSFGTNEVTIVEGITAFLAYKGTAYVSANDLEFRYTDGTGQKVTADIDATFLTSTSSVVHHAPAEDLSFAAPQGEPIVAFVPVADPTTGTSPITLVICYRVVSFNV